MALPYESCFLRPGGYGTWPLKAGWLRLELGETKNDDGRNFPLTQELRAVLEEQVSKTRALELATGQIIQWLFHRNGEPIKNFRRAWLSAGKLAGVPGPAAARLQADGMP